MVVDASKEYSNQQVDFFMPTIKLVIEIDGAQHSELGQSVLDKKRDLFLKLLRK
ncbi:DUF559 domain-containing protein [Butyrivibrio sp. JL13D10]|uniref:DUF559 domain-containing protein n=1 Tax=Butyrivibrio sp. JL13D10 TaxID=3236815 RepID=UPI0038B461BB